MMVTGKVDMGCDGSIMPFSVFKRLFSNTAADQLVAIKDTTMLRTYNSTTITQFMRCGIAIENKNECKKCIFFLLFQETETCY